MATVSLPNSHFHTTPSAVIAPQSQSQQQQKQEPKKKKPIRQAVGIIVLDLSSQKVLMLSSRKREGALVLPRGDCAVDPAEHPEKAAVRVLMEEAGVSASYLTRRVGTYTEANKKGKIVAHHWMFEIHAPTLLKSWPSSDRKRVWVPLNEALEAVSDRRIAYLALSSSSLARKQY